MPVSTVAKPPGHEKIRAAKGARTRESILHVAVNLASLEGLQGLSIGRLADELKMSKSGLFAHFGSKEDLQLATVEMARQIVVEHVIRPALAQPEGMPRLWALCDGWLGHVEKRVFAGGCFFTAASFEFDSRSGPVRDSIADAMRAWLGVLSEAVARAQKCGHLKTGFDPEKFAFEMYSLVIGSHWGHGLFGDRKPFSNSRAMILARLQALATSKCPPLAVPSPERRRLKNNSPTRKF
jgi:AcrR family transcriptional regulator